MKSIGKTALLVGATLFGAAMSMAWSVPANANPAFDDATGGQPCSACHLPGREEEVPGGFNSTGQMVYSAYQGAGTCHMKIGCAVALAFPVSNNMAPAPYPTPAPYSAPAPAPAPYVAPAPYPAPAPYVPPRPQSYMFRFYDHCDGSDSYFIVRRGGSPSREVRFMLKNGHDIRIDGATGTTFASACGGWPSGGFQPASY